MTVDGATDVVKTEAVVPEENEDGTVEETTNAEPEVNGEVKTPSLSQLFSCTYGLKEVCTCHVVGSHHVRCFWSEDLVIVAIFKRREPATITVGERQ